MKDIVYQPIGFVKSDIKSCLDAPIQPTSQASKRAIIELNEEFVDGLKDLDGFSHIIVLYHMHLAKQPKLIVKPFMDDNLHGIFAIRGPNRPNPIGLSIVRLEAIKGNEIIIANADIVDATPVLDIKPYVTHFDAVENAEIGWLEGKATRAEFIKSDDRFIK